jgi:hypothetical protein
MFTNLKDISDFLDYEGKPYRYLIRCDIGDTLAVVHIEKWEGKWGIVSSSMDLNNVGTVEK